MKPFLSLAAEVRAMHYGLHMSVRAIAQLCEVDKRLVRSLLQRPQVLRSVRIIDNESPRARRMRARRGA